MSKTMCKTKDAEKRAKKQADPRFECAKCGKKVNREKYVCKPEKL
jgi:transposase-like protein